MADLWSEYQSKLQPLNQQSESLLRDYLTMQAQAPTFQQKLLDAIKQAGQYPSHAEIRAEYAQNPNLTPMAIEALVSRRGQAGRGTIQDIISRAYGGLQSDVAQKQSLSQVAQQQRQNLLEEYGLAQQAEKAKQPSYLTLGEGQTVYDPATGEVLYKTPKTYKPTEQVDLSWLINILRSKGTSEAEPTEPMPLYSPGKEGAVSPGGQWIYHNREWMINVLALS